MSGVRASRMRGTACVSKMEQRLLICVMYTADLPHWLCAPHRWATCEIRYVLDVSPPVAVEPDAVVLPSGVSEAPTVLVGSALPGGYFVVAVLPLGVPQPVSALAPHAFLLASKWGDARGVVHDMFE